MSTNKATSKKTTTQSSTKTVKVAPKAKPPVKTKETDDETANAETANAETVEVKVVKTEQVQEPETNKAAKPTSERFERASLAASEANKIFISALRERCRLMGTSLNGESCGIRNFSPEVAEINEQIKNTKAMLNDLLNRRRELSNVSPEIEVINLKITGLRKARNLARAEKKLAASNLCITLHQTLGSRLRTRVFCVLRRCVGSHR